MSLFSCESIWSVLPVCRYSPTLPYDYLHEKTDSNEEIVAMENDPDLDSNSENEDNEPQELPTELHKPEMTVTAFWKAFSVKNAVGSTKGGRLR